MNSPAESVSQARKQVFEIPVDPGNLPDDSDTLKEIIRALLEKLRQAKTISEGQAHQLEQLLRARYGRKSEKFNPEQITLFAIEEMMRESVEQKAEEAEKEVEETTGVAKKRAGSSGRKRLPENLPRIRIEHDLPAEAKKCDTCETEMTRIGEETSERLEYVPATLKVEEHVTPKYACAKGCGGVKTAEKPLQMVEKGIAGPGLLAHVAVSKYADHLPLNRLEGILGRIGADISRQTMCDWMAACAKEAAPLYDLMKAEALLSRRIHTDDTIVEVLDPGRGKTVNGRMWGYVGDDEHPVNVFDFTMSRKRDGPEKFLGRWKGWLQADAFRGYDAIYAGGKIHEVACWAHARRKYVDVGSSDTANSAMAMAWIQRLYAVESDAKEQNLGESETLELRQEKSAPVMEQFRAWLDETMRKVLPKSPMGQAIGYTVSNWTALNAYLQHGFLAIDNNAAERSLRTVAVGRKNWLFAGSENGGRTAATMITFVSTCKRHGVDPFAWFRDLFTRLPETKTSDLRQFLPHEWKKTLVLPAPEGSSN